MRQALAEKRSPVFWATISRSNPRRAEWLQVFGTDRLPVLSPTPHAASVACVGARLFYRVDVSSLNEEQRARLASFLSAKWGWSPAEVLASLDDPAHGLPVLAEGVTIGIDARLFS